MAKLYSIPEAAADIGRNRTTIYKACRHHGVGIKVGSSIVLTSAEVEHLRKILPGVAGNPAFVPGNYFGGTKKRPKPRKKPGLKKT
jgi:hypothetical protein